MLSFTNNSSPLFILGTCGITLFKNASIGVLLLISHFISAITVGYIFRFWKKSKPILKNQTNRTSVNNNKLQLITKKNFGEILGKSIQTSIFSILNIGGFIVLFSVLISILNNSGIVNLIEMIFKPFCNFFNIPVKIPSSLFLGSFEITNGLNILSNIKIKNISLIIILTSFLLGIGGISIFFQILSIVSKSDLSIKPYIIGKLLQGIFSCIYTYILISIFPVFNFNL